MLNYSTKNTRILKDGALPTLKLPLRTASGGSQRSERLTKRRRIKEVDEILASNFGTEPSTSQLSTRTVSSERETEECDTIRSKDSAEM